MKVYIIRFFCFCVLVLITVPALAQNYKITGTVMDKNAKTPLRYVIVLLKDTTGSSTLYSALTDNDGQFQLSSLHQRCFLLVIQNVSYKKVSRKIEISEKSIK